MSAAVSPAEALPVAAILPALTKAFQDTRKVVLQAPPGAGKSTQLPLYLLTDPQFAGQRILLLQPRRVAAVNIAHFLAEHLQSPLGEQVGYHIRGEQKFNAKTRLLILTEGMFTRYLQADPELAGVGLVIFDEFHERNLQSDLGLAMLLDTLQLRSDLKVLVMSATLPAAALAQWLTASSTTAETPTAVLRSEGRQYEVELEYRPIELSAPWSERVQAWARATEAAVARATRGVLVFLPGQAEIRAVAERLNLPNNVPVLPLHGQLPLAAQRLAVAPASDDMRVVLATNVAETSLTLANIDVVVDSGEVRRAEFLPQHGLSQLTSQRVSRAEATQRAGRAGRLGPGLCIRVWPASSWQSRAEYAPADIEVQDLTSLLLEAKLWGSEPTAMAFFSAPNRAHLSQAEVQLQALGALADTGSLTATGKAMAQYGVEPRLARIALQAAEQSLPTRALAAYLLAWLEQPPQQNEQDLLLGLSRYPPAALRWRYWQRRLQVAATQQAPNWAQIDAEQVAALLLWGYPDRLGVKRGDDGNAGVLPLYKMAYGGGAKAGGHQRAPRTWPRLVLAPVLSAREEQVDAIWRWWLPLTEQALAHPAVAITTQTSAIWQGPQQRLVKVKQQWLGKALWDEQPLAGEVTALELGEALLAVAPTQALPAWLQQPEVAAWLARVRWYQQVLQPADWPNFSAAELAAELREWALPYWQDLRSIKQLQQWSALAALQARLGFNRNQQLQQACPTHWLAPSGRSVSIEYRADAVVAAIKLQEVFGTPVSPRVLAQQVPLTLELLSPAGRLLQRTQDLASFWQNGYAAVKKEMRGRYPKHPWPDDPLRAVATHKTKRHL